MMYYDLHTHSTLSDGSQTVAALVAAAGAKGYGLGVSDHIFCSKLTDCEKIGAYLDELEHYPVLRGAEANLGEDFSLPGPLNRRMDYIIASVHSVSDRLGQRVSLTPYFCARGGDANAVFHRICTVSESQWYLEQILRIYEESFSTQRVDILGHCMVTPFHDDWLDTPYMKDWQDAAIALCKKHGVALEISGLWRSPDEDMARRAIKAGVKLTIGSDCHQARSTCDINYPVSVIRKLEAGPGHILLPERGT